MDLTSAEKKLIADAVDARAIECVDELADIAAAFDPKNTRKKPPRPLRVAKLKREVATCYSILRKLGRR